MKIYTKTGDDGTTSLFDGQRVFKSDARVSVYGDVDETCAAIGLAQSFISDKTLKNQLKEIQRDLFALGAKLANPQERKQKAKADFGLGKSKRLEKWIDIHEAKLSPLKNFILPGGSPAAATLHLARTICRRAERGVTELGQKEKLDKAGLIYLNRLSDYLFVAARSANQLAGTKDIPWE